MLDSQTLLGLFGIALSILFFVVGYRQTIGARKERIRAATREAIESLLKRVVLENFMPQRSEIDRFLSGKAREHLLKSADMPTVEEVLESLYSRVIDNDFIGPEERTRIIERLRSLRAPDPAAEAESLVLRSASGPRPRRRAASLLLGLASSIAGTALSAFLAVVYSQFGGIDGSVQLPALVLTFVIAFSLVGALIALRRVKETQEETRPAEPANRGLLIERGVLDLVRAAGLKPTPVRNAPFDFVIDGERGKFLVEVKTSLNRLPPSYLRLLIQRLSEEVKARQASKAFLVSAAPIPERVAKLALQDVVVLDVSEFSDQLAKLGRKTDV